MRVITKIAKNELRNLFYSPIAWFLFVALMVLCAFYYAPVMYMWAKQVDLMQKSKITYLLWSNESVTYLMMNNRMSGFFTMVMQHLYLFVPLLTMNVISREFNSGAVKLLYSSPVKLQHIVLGKFLALTIYNLLLVAVIGIFIVAACFDIKSVDLPPLLSAAFGIWLFLCAVSAIGLFMSSLTNYQIVSAISSFTLLFILSRIGELWKEYDFIRDITYFLSVNGRLEKLQVGLITSKDIIYYLIIMFMFLSFTLFKLRAGRESRPWHVIAARYASVVVVSLVIGYISSRPAFTAYRDVTARKMNTIHPRTQEALKELSDSTLEITLYTNLFANYAQIGMPAARNEYISQLWEQYQRFKVNIEYRYEYYYALPDGDSTLYKRFPGKSLKQIAGLMARLYKVDSAMFKSPEEMKKIADLEPEDYKVVMQLKYQGRKTFLRTTFIEATWPDQMTVNAAFRRLLQEPMPKVYFLTGQLERSVYKRGEREFFLHTLSKAKMGSLLNAGFDVDSLSLASQDIPTDASLLVIADSRTELNATVKTKLHNWVANGGNMLVLGEPGKQDVLNPMLQQIGVQFNNGQLVQPSVNETPDKPVVYFTFDCMKLAEEAWLVKFRNIWAQKVYDDSLSIPLKSVVAISSQNSSDSGFKATSLLLTKPDLSWLKAGKLVVDSAAPVFNASEGDSKQRTYEVISAFTRNINNKEQRIVVAGDADFASNSVQIDDLSRSIYSWLVNNRYPVYTRYPDAKDNTVLVKPARARVQKLLFIWILPALVMVTGALLLIRRKRK